MLTGSFLPPFSIERSEKENLFENWHLCQRKVETHLSCVALSARARSGSATWWTCSVLTETRRGSKDTAFLYGEMACWQPMVVGLDIYLDEYTFLAPKCPLSFAGTSPRNPHSGGVWIWKWGTQDPDLGITGFSQLFCQTGAQSLWFYIHVYVLLHICQWTCIQVT